MLINILKNSLLFFYYCEAEVPQGQIACKAVNNNGATIVWARQPQNFGYVIQVIDVDTNSLVEIYTTEHGTEEYTLTGLMPNKVYRLEISQEGGSTINFARKLLRTGKLNLYRTGWVGGGGEDTNHHYLPDPF